MAKQQIFSVARMAKQVSSLGQRNEEWKKGKKKRKEKVYVQNLSTQNHLILVVLGRWIKIRKKITGFGSANMLFY